MSKDYVLDMSRHNRLARAVAAACEPLESRRLLAADWTGTGEPEVIDIVMNGTNYVDIKVNGTVVATLSTSTPLDIYAGAGNDLITVDSAVPASVQLILVGQDGNDTLIGGAGNDTLYGDNYLDSGGAIGTDSLVGNGGNDFLSGGRASDTLDGGAGQDIISYIYATWANSAGYVIDLASSNTATTVNGEVDSFSSAETVYGSPGPDSITGSAADEYLHGQGGNDVIDAGDGADTLDGFDGNDTLEGGAGNDSIRGGRGNDSLSGSEGDDTLDGQDGNDIYDGDSGIDTAKFTLVSGVGAGSLNLTLDDVANDTSNGYTDNVQSDMEVISGTPSADRIVGSSGNETLLGNAHHDTLIGGDGDDVLDGGTGTDTVDYSDASNAGGVNISLDGVANDTANGYTDNVLANVENIIGSSGNDVLTGSASANSLWGGDGNDIISGLGGNDSIWGGNGSDTIYGGAGSDSIVVNDDSEADDVEFDVLDLLSLTTGLDNLL